MCAHSVLILLAPDSVVSRLEPAGGISAHVSSILAGPLLPFPQMLGGPRPAPACPASLTAHPLELLSVLDPGIPGSQDLCQEQQGQSKTHKIEDFPHL
jgi:hypothetical protein